MKTLLALFCWGILVGPVLADNEPLELSTLRNKWIAAKSAAARPLKTKYLDALVVLRDRFTKQERLEAALLVRNEIEFLTGNKVRNGDEEDDPGAPAELLALKATYEREMKKIEDTNDQKYRKGLENLLRSFSGNGKLEAALAVKTELDKAFLTGPEEVEVDAWASVEVTKLNTIATVEILKEGVERLSGQYRPTFEHVDKELWGLKFLRIEYGNTADFTVKVLKPGKFILLGVEDIKIKDDELVLKLNKTLIKGSYINYVYSTTVIEGQTFAFDGPGDCIVAKGITIK